MTGLAERKGDPDSALSLTHAYYFPAWRANAALSHS